MCKYEEGFFLLRKLLLTQSLTTLRALVLGFAARRFRLLAYLVHFACRHKTTF